MIVNASGCSKVDASMSLYLEINPQPSSLSVDAVLYIQVSRENRRHRPLREQNAAVHLFSMYCVRPVWLYRPCQSTIIVGRYNQEEHIMTVENAVVKLRKDGQTFPSVSLSTHSMKIKTLAVEGDRKAKSIIHSANSTSNIVLVNYFASFTIDVLTHRHWRMSRYERRIGT